MRGACRVEQMGLPLEGVFSDFRCTQIELGKKQKERLPSPFLVPLCDSPRRRSACHSGRILRFPVPVLSRLADPSGCSSLPPVTLGAGCQHPPPPAGPSQSGTGSGASVGGGGARVTPPLPVSPRSCGPGWRSCRRSCWMTCTPSPWRPCRTSSSASASSSRPRCK